MAIARRSARSARHCQLGPATGLVAHKEPQLIQPRLASYIVTHDTGFAPNPFFGYCTLACSKPEIRRSAQPGDWIVGLSQKNDGNRIVYAMRVGERITFAEYWLDPRFTDKKPDLLAQELERHCGDNIYEALDDGMYRQLRSAHTYAAMDKDLRGKYVLIATEFTYFGKRAVELPPAFGCLIARRGYICTFLPELIRAFVRYISQFGFGLHGKPTMWPPKWGRISDDVQNRACAS
jgi:hypothetical protein